MVIKISAAIKQRVRQKTMLWEMTPVFMAEVPGMLQSLRYCLFMCVCISETECVCVCVCLKSHFPSAVSLMCCSVTGSPVGYHVYRPTRGPACRLVVTPRAIFRAGTCGWMTCDMHYWHKQKQKQLATPYRHWQTTVTTCRALLIYWRIYVSKTLQKQNLRDQFERNQNRVTCFQLCFQMKAKLVFNCEKAVIPALTYSLASCLAMPFSANSMTL